MNRTTRCILSLLVLGVGGCSLMASKHPPRRLAPELELPGRWERSWSAEVNARGLYNSRDLVVIANSEANRWPDLAWSEPPAEWLHEAIRRDTAATDPAAPRLALFVHEFGLREIGGALHAVAVVSASRACPDGSARSVPAARAETALKETDMGDLAAALSQIGNEVLDALALSLRVPASLCASSAAGDRR